MSAEILNSYNNERILEKLIVMISKLQEMEGKKKAEKYKKYVPTESVKKS